MESYRWKRTSSNEKDTKATYKYTTSKVMTWNVKKKVHCQSSAFKKHIYEDQHRNLGIVHYMGSKDDVKRSPHGNSKSDAPFICTRPAVKERIAEYGLTKQPKQILDDQNRTLLAGMLSAIESGRDTNHIKYLQL